MLKFKINLNILMPLVIFVLIVLIYSNIMKNKQLTAQENIINSPIENFDPNYLTFKDVVEQDKIRNMFSVTDNILTSLNITYWIIGGTLLGAYRNNDLLPWNDDSALAILDTDVFKFQNANNFFNEKNYTVVEQSYGYNIIINEKNIVK